MADDKHLNDIVNTVMGVNAPIAGDFSQPNTLEDPLDSQHAVDLMDTVMGVNQPIRQMFVNEDGEEVDDPNAPQPITDTELKSILAQKIQSSHQWYGTGKLASQRMSADRYYNGDLMGNEIEGRSQVVSRDVAEVVDSILPSLMRIFASGDEVVSFEPNEEKDEEAAKQATDYINWLFNQKNDGFNILHTWFKDALLKRNGIVKAWYEKKINRTKDDYSGLTPEQFALFQNDPTYTILKQTQNENQIQVIDPVTGAPSVQTAITFDCSVMLSKPECKICVANVAPDEFIIERRATGLDTTGFVAHRTKRTFSELIELGFDKDIVYSIPRGDDQEYSQERIERFKDEDQLPFATEGDSVDESMRKVWVTEAYIKIDYDGDGIAEWRKVTLAGDTGQVGIILDNEEVDDHPFASITPIPMSHKFYGKSVYDQCSDLQDIKTALIRGGLDSIYLANSPRLGVVEGQANIDDLLDSRVGGIVRIKNPNAIVPIPTVMAAPQAFQMVEYIDGVREQRTGITRYNQGLQADTLNKTATGINLISNAGQQREEMIARIFAETGVKRLFNRLFTLTCLHVDKPQTVRLRGKWVNIDPKSWKNHMDLTVSVGIGMGNKQQQLQTAMALLQMDQQIVTLQGGIKGPILTGKNIYNKLTKLIEAAGWKYTEPYYTDPDTFKAPPPPPTPPPSPDQMKDLAALEMKKIDLQIKSMELQVTKLEALMKVGPAALIPQPDSIPSDQPIPQNLGPQVHPVPVMATPQQGR